MMFVQKDRDPARSPEAAIDTSTEAKAGTNAQTWSVFGYGSLVNERTLSGGRLQAAVLEGWRREWCLTHLRPVAFLSIRPAEGHRIDGLLSTVFGDDWSALDRRERAYDRHNVSHAVTSAVGSVAAYAVRPDLRRQGGGTILLSYLDVVVQGFHDRFGEPGVQRFFETTDGWDRVIVDDRDAPRYARAQRLTDRETALVDAHLAGLSAVVEKLEDPVVPRER